MDNNLNHLDVPPEIKNYIKQEIELSVELLKKMYHHYHEKAH
ncbi:MAG: hypothetical protein [Wendovervirus sonii]|uniref:Uncharacterized protein n=1 Tax=phage Lak_Megaphage_Sonny TaxID=3109229 RepID=A0ABZ0Z3Y8_9CAUD|nr:MAG: hypothetical protein [phage Lak_Megaphage_Sonny]